MQRGQIEKNLIFLRIYVVRLCCVGVISSSHLLRRRLLLLLLKRTLQKEKKNRFWMNGLKYKISWHAVGTKVRNYICSGESRLQVTEFKKWANPSLLFFIFSPFYVIQLKDKYLPMLGFEPRISGVWSDHSANWATTTANSGDRVQIDVPCYQGAKPEVPFTSSCSIRESKQHLSWAQCYDKSLGGWIPKINIFSQNYISRDNKQKNNLNERWAH